MMWWGPSVNWSAGTLMMGVSMLLFWGLIVAVAVVLLRRFSAGPSSSEAQRREPDRAISILEERFARGEIDREEFEQRRQVLRG